MVGYKKRRFNIRIPKKKLSLYRRHHGLVTLEVSRVKKYQKYVNAFRKAIEILQTGIVNEITLYLCDVFYIMQLLYVYKIYKILDPTDLNSRIPRILNLNRTIDSFLDSNIPIYFRFRNKEQLKRLIVGFRIPDFVYVAETHKFSAEEILLIGLYRLHVPNTLGDAVWQHVFGQSYTRISMAFNQQR